MSKAYKFLVYILALALGVCGGGLFLTYQTLPETEEVVVGEEVFYSYNNSEVQTAEFTNGENTFSVHFVELGNKYTGDCTYIKYGDVDILIDCGSRTNSISAVSNYLNQYVADNTLEYVIVTHAHRDHYAGFATSTKVDSIFDLYKCERIIDFGLACNQSETATTYKNYIRERDAEISQEDFIEYIPAISCRNQDDSNRQFIIDEQNNVKFEVLYNPFHQYDRTKADTTHKAGSENDYSVCTLFSFGEKTFLFTGDLEAEGEAELVENNQVLKDMKTNNEDYGVNLYKAGHHGSGTSSSEILLEAIRPEVVCVCCCAGSSEYTDDPVKQFPTQEFINRIAPYTRSVYVTTLCVDWEKDEFSSMNGNIVVWVDIQNVINVNCSNNDKKLYTTDWFKQNRTCPASWQ